MKQPSESQVSAWTAKVRADLREPEGIFTREAAAEAARLCFAAAQPGIKPSPQSTSAVMDMLSPLTGYQIDGKMLMRNITRILANWHFIREGMRVPEWDGTQTPTDIIVLGVAPVREPVPRPSHLVAVKLKTGLCAGIITCGPMTDASVYAFLQHKSGTSRHECAAEDVAGMRARVTASYLGGKFRIHSWDTTEKQKTHNRDLVERREDPMKCPAGAMPCNVCPRNIRECPLAVWLPDPKPIPKEVK